MGLIYLFMAIILEVAGTTSLKLSNGLTKLVPSVAMFVLYALSFTVFSFALKKIEVGVGYAIWSGLGTALIASIGVMWFKESMNVIKLLSLVLIIIGVIGLNIGSAGH